MIDNYIIKKISFKNNNPMFDIEHGDLIYCALNDNYHGLQTKFKSDSEEYKKILEHCTKIIENIKEIDKLLCNKQN